MTLPYQEGVSSFVFPTVVGPRFLPGNPVKSRGEPAGFIGTLGGLTFATNQGISGKSYGWDADIADPRSSALLLAEDELWLGTEAGLAQYRIR